MQIEQISGQEFRRHALSILQRELGPADFARFLRLYRPGHGKYTEERDRWLKGVTIEDIAEQTRARSTAKRPAC